jgi:hypothetical protein
MRNGQNNKRMRNRNNNNNNNNNNRRGQNPMTRVFESNGPDIKIRGTASHVAEKYVQLARDARSSGDPVAAENYYQHAEHYFRLIAAAQEQFRQNQPQPRPDAEVVAEEGDEDEGFSNFGQEPGFVPVQQQPYQPRENNQRDHQQSYQPREQHQPREHNREPRNQPQFQPQPQPSMPDNGGVDRLPSFITGPQPQINGGQGGFEGNGGERFPPRRRRRPHGPRPEGMAAGPAAPGDDFNPGNE